MVKPLTAETKTLFDGLASMKTAVDEMISVAVQISDTSDTKYPACNARYKDGILETNIHCIEVPTHYGERQKEDRYFDTTYSPVLEEPLYVFTGEKAVEIQPSTDITFTSRDSVLIDVEKNKGGKERRLRELEGISMEEIFYETHDKPLPAFRYSEGDAMDPHGRKKKLVPGLVFNLKSELVFLDEHQKERASYGGYKDQYAFIPLPVELNETPRRKQRGIKLLALK